MYPDFQYLFQSLFGTDMPVWLSIFKTFGFFVALSFIGAAWTSTIELKRREKLGLLHPQISTIIEGLPPKTSEIVISAIFGFILGFKVGGLFGHWTDVAPNPLGYLLSADGNFLGALVGAVALGYMKYAEKKKEQLAEPVTKRVATYPHQRMSEMVIIAAVGGLIGAKVFNALETWDDFIHDPIGNLFSSSGLTFYGGLIVATAAFYFYGRKHKIPFVYLCDSIAPGLMLAYGVGRLGCHFSGDGDWGIFNTAYISNPDGTLRLSTPADAPVISHMIGNVQHAFATAPSWLPRWVYGMNYAHNVNNEGMSIANCVGNYCHVLPVSVFPTPIYEAITCIGLFFVLWSMRGRLVRPWQMFGLYLIFNGIERFFVELIRVNTKYDFGFIHPTQAELISVGMLLVGIYLLVRNKKTTLTDAQSEA